MSKGYSGLFYGTMGSICSMETGIEDNTILITNKFPLDNQEGKEFYFKIDNGKIKTENGIRKFDFIIDNRGFLHIGKGHSYLARRESVYAAGKMKINSDGVVRHISNLSGHYRPSVSQALQFVDAFNHIGVNVLNAWISIYNLGSTTSGYTKILEEAYSGPIKYMRRHIK